ncbi:MAG: hypothetical protein F4X12_16310 [Acidobacteriia bacterium]|nr:hypothetical protein [Terriglobia bacterium]
MTRREISVIPITTLAVACAPLPVPAMTKSDELGPIADFYTHIEEFVFRHGSERIYGIRHDILEAENNGDWPEGIQVEELYARDPGSDMYTVIQTPKEFHERESAGIPVLKLWFEWSEKLRVIQPRAITPAGVTKIMQSMHCTADQVEEGPVAG